MKGKNPLELLGALGGLGEMIRERQDVERWNSRDLGLLERAWQRKASKAPAPPAKTLVRTQLPFPRIVGMVVGPHPQPFVATDDSLPFAHETHDTLLVLQIVDCDCGDEHDAMLSAVPGWSLEPLNQEELEAVRTSGKIALESFVDRYNEPSDFTPGQPVTWKEGMNNRKQTGTFIFLEKIPWTAGVGDDGKREINRDHDCRILTALGGTPVTFMVDSRRLRPM